MKEIKLNRLSLKHFKGLDSFEFEPLGKNATVLDYSQNPKNRKGANPLIAHSS